MIAHIKLLTGVLSIVVATLTSVFLFNRARARPEKWWWPIFHYTLAMDAIMVISLILSYVKLNLPDMIQTGGFFSGKLTDLTVSIMIMVLLIIMARIVWAFESREPPRWINWTAGSLLALTLIGYTVMFLAPDLRFCSTGMNWLRDYIYENIMVLETVMLVWLLVRSRHQTDPELAKAMKTFAWLYLGRYIGALFILIIAFFGDISLWLKWLVGHSLLIASNALPWFWVRFFLSEPQDSADAQPDRSVEPAPAEPDFKSKAQSFGLSAREIEILELILMGKSNRGIESELCISIHTVKNHLYNIYKKLGVSSRFQVMACFNASSPSGDISDG